MDNKNISITSEISRVWKLSSKNPEQKPDKLFLSGLRHRENTIRIGPILSLRKPKTQNYIFGGRRKNCLKLFADFNPY